MTIGQISEKWKVSPKTALSYIIKGWICDLQVQGNLLIIPDIPKPYKITKIKKLSAQENIYRNILRATSNLEYISCYMLEVSQEIFETSLNILTNEGYLFTNRPQTKTNVGYTVSPKGLQLIKKDKFADIAANFSLINGAANIGLFNISL